MGMAGVELGCWSGCSGYSGVLDNGKIGEVVVELLILGFNSTIIINK